MTGPSTLVEALAGAEANPAAGLRFVDRREDARFLSWAELGGMARRVAGGLQAGGIERGDRVGLVFPTSPEFVAGYCGVLLAGGVPVPLYPPLRLGRLKEYQEYLAGLLEASGARLLLADPHIRKLLGEALAKARLRGGLALGCHGLAELPVATCAPVAVTGGDLALVQFSSGTTAQPRPVALSHRAVLAQLQILNRMWPDSEAVVHSAVSWLPLYHDMGLIGFLCSALWRPAVLTLLKPETFAARPALWLRAISRYGATISGAPNFAYALATAKVRDEELDGVDLSRWRIALNGAETVVARTVFEFSQRFARWGFRADAMTPVYGLAEAALAVTFSPLGRAPRVLRRDGSRPAASGEKTVNLGEMEFVSSGRPIAGFEVEVRRDKEPANAGEEGDIWVAGPSLMEGYLGLPEETVEVLQDGWLRTGDRGFLFDGELFLTGRAKDVLLLRGRSHSPEWVEQAAGRLPGVREDGVIAASWLEPGAGEETLAVFVERARGTPLSPDPELAESVRAAVLAATGLRAAIVEVLPSGSLPRTSSGKLRRGETARLYREGRLRAPGPVGPEGLARLLTPRTVESSGR
jgi:acyl-CoA synthetase (AMP-forming)/AMP-acid ligase II